MKMKCLFLISLIFMCFLSCSKKPEHQNESADVEYGEDVLNDKKGIRVDTEYIKPKYQSDIDTLSITANKIHHIKSEGNNHFELQIELPCLGDDEINKKLLYWINSNLEDNIIYALSTPDTLANNNSKFVNKVYDGDLFDYDRLAHFYSNKHFSIFNGLQMGIDYDITCKKVYESKDVISYEINNFFCNYSTLDSKSIYKGVTFFKYNGNILSWAMFENSNVKDIVQKELNNQFFKFPEEKYRDFLSSSKYGTFTLPSNPPYLVKDGLKFIYKNKEMSEKEGNDQIYCVIPVDKIGIMPSLAELLQ